MVALGGEVATTDLLADEAGELPLQSGVLVPPLVEFVLVGAAPLDAPEFGDAYADAFEQALGPLPAGGGVIRRPLRVRAWARVRVRSRAVGGGGRASLGRSRCGVRRARAPRARGCCG